MFFCFVPDFVFSANPVSHSWESEKISLLSHHPYWLKLLHYYLPGESIGQWSARSDIVSSGFFLAPNGNTDPEAELKATLAAILEPPGEDPDRHARCRFIARTRWLMEELEFPELQQIHCPLFKRWANLEEATGIRIIFVSAYLGNPASAFGHILIQFRTKNRYFSHTLLSPTLNFGAITNADDGPVEYVLRGLFGGYEGGFSDERFYNFNHVYGENEQRDLWSYPLRLTKSESDRVIFHTWELLHQVRFSYYFFLDNCAYRMAELIETAWTDDRRLNTPQAMWAIPIHVIHKLKEIPSGDGQLLGEPELIPSRQRRLRQSVQKLDESEKAWLGRFLEGEVELDDPDLGKQNLESRARILDALIDYLQFEHEGKFDGETLELRGRILSMRSTLPILENHQPINAPADPSQGSAPMRFRLGMVHNPEMPQGKSKETSSLEIGFLGSYHDLLGEEKGHLANREIITFDLRLRYSDKTINLTDFMLLSIQNLSGNPTGIPGDREISWRFQAGIERFRLDCLICRQFHLKTGMGFSASPGNHQIFYSFIDLFGQAEKAVWTQTSWGVSPHLGLLWKPFRIWKVKLEGGWYKSFAGPKKDYLKSMLHQRWSMAQNLDLRLEYNQKAENSEGILSLNYYW